MRSSLTQYVIFAAWVALCLPILSANGMVLTTAHHSRLMARQSPLLAELDEIMALRSNEDVLELGKKTGERGLDETNEKRKEAKERAAAQAEAQAEAKKQAMLQDKTAQEDMETVMIGDSTASATKGAPTITSPDVDELHVSASSNNLNGASPLSGAAAGEQARVGGIIQKASGSTNVA